MNRCRRDSVAILRMQVSRCTVSDISNISLTEANLYIVNLYSGARPDTTSFTTFVEAYYIR